MAADDVASAIGRIAMTQYDSYVDRTLLIFKSFLVPMDKWYFMYIVYQKFQIEKQKAHAQQRLRGEQSEQQRRKKNRQ